MPAAINSLLVQVVSTSREAVAVMPIYSMPTANCCTVEDFSAAKGDTLTIDEALQGSMHQRTDGEGGTMLTFGAGAGQAVDIHGLALMPSSSIVWG